MKLNNRFVISAVALAVQSIFNQVLAQEQVLSSENNQQTAVVAEQGDAAVTLETITVTARRRVEREQDVPAPISVIQSQQLEDAKIYQVQDLQQLLPNFTSQFIHSRQSSVAVRGIGNNTANEGLEGSVGIYLDNVYLGRPGQAVFDLLDIEQIDLLRGPQGTLFGKNTTAGVLNISTKKPVFHPERTIEVSAGERGYKQGKVTLNQPLSEQVAVRISAYGTRDDGWIDNIYDGSTLNEIDRYGVRGQILFEPSETFNLRVIAEHNSEDSSTGSLIPYSSGPWNPSGAPASNLPLGEAGSNATTYIDRAVLLGARYIDPYDFKVDFDGEQQSKVKQNALSAELNWDVNGFKVTSITAWRDWQFNPKNDLDFTRLAALSGGFSVDQNQLSQELRLASPVSEVFDYVLGVYYYRQNIDSNNAYETGVNALALTTAYPNFAQLQGFGEAKTDSYALFGQSTWHVTTELDLTAGLRYTLEKKQGQVNQGEIVPGAYAFLSPLFQSYSSGWLEREDNNLSGLLTASYKFSPTVLGFVTYSTGEKSGGFNVNSVATPAAILGLDAITIEPEKARNIDIGLKTTWLNNRVLVNTNVFRTEISGYQAITNSAIGFSNQYISLLTNVGDLTSQGLEFDIKVQASSQLSLNFNAAYTDATFDSGTAPTPFEEFHGDGGDATSGYGKGFRDIRGNRVNGAPRWTLNAGVDHRWHISETIKHYTSVNYGWRSETYADVNNSVYSEIPGYSVFNINTGLIIPHGDNQLSLSLWAKNAFDKHYFLGLVNSGNGLYAGSAAQPRTIGVSLRYDF